MENEYLFNKLLWDKMSIGMQQKKNPDTDLTTYTKINSKWITDLTINLKVIKLLEKKKIRENLSDLEFVNNFLETTTEAGSMKEKKKWMSRASLKQKLLLCERHYHENEKISLRERKIFAKCLANKRLLSRLYK